MTSPELLARHGGNHVRATSDTSTIGAAYSVSVTSNGHHNDQEDDLFVGNGPLPGWGAGWAVQRGGRGDGRPGTERIKLMDVGRLLK